MKITSNIVTKSYKKRRVIILKYAAPQINRQSNRLTMNYMAIETHFVASLSYWIDLVWKHNDDAPLKE